MNLTLLLALISQLAPLLSKFLGSNWTSLITATTTAIGTLWAAFTSGGSVTSELEVALQALQNEANAVLTATNATDEDKAIAAEVVSLAQDALNGYADAMSGKIDPGTLPIPPEVQ